MKKFLIVLCFAMSSVAVEAQETLTWHTDMAEAVKVSKKNKKPLFLFFTGSDWCGWCTRLQKEVFKTPEFAAWAKKNVVLVELDFPRKAVLSPEMKQQNASLAQMFGVRGYPTVWITKAEKDKGNDTKINFTPLGNTGYVAGGPTTWLDGANKILANKPPKVKK